VATQEVEATPPSSPERAAKTRRASVTREIPELATETGRLAKSRMWLRSLKLALIPQEGRAG
jgi:hypothetical protein